MCNNVSTISFVSIDKTECLLEVVEVEISIQLSPISPIQDSVHEPISSALLAHAIFPAESLALSL
jgi:hypothetical protein